MNPPPRPPHSPPRSPQSPARPPHSSIGPPQPAPPPRPANTSRRPTAPPIPPNLPFGPGGFGPVGSGGYSAGVTPVPIRQNADETVIPKEPERRRPTFLVEGEHDEMFGNEEFTAPPVIGE